MLMLLGGLYAFRVLFSFFHGFCNRFSYGYDRSPRLPCEITSTSSTVQTTGFNVVLKRPPAHTKTTSTRMTSVSSGRAWHALIRTHHITSRKKVAKLRQSASAEDVYALIHYGGPPGIMYVEGDKSGVASWVAAVQVCQQTSSLSAFHRRTSCRFWHAYRYLSIASPL